MTDEASCGNCGHPASYHQGSGFPCSGGRCRCTFSEGSLAEDEVPSADPIEVLRRRDRGLGMDRPRSYYEATESTYPNESGCWCDGPPHNGPCSRVPLTEDPQRPCPTPEYHDSHRYCPSCPWTERDDDA